MRTALTLFREKCLNWLQVFMFCRSSSFFLCKWVVIGQNMTLCYYSKVSYANVSFHSITCFSHRIIKQIKKLPATHNSDYFYCNSERLTILFFFLVIQNCEILTINCNSEKKKVWIMRWYLARNINSKVRICKQDAIDAFVDFKM